MGHLLASGNEETRRIWCEQGEEGDEGSLVYPPRRLQSTCALWQAPDAPQPARAALLLLLLFDAIAVNAVSQAAVTAKPSRARGVHYQSEGGEGEVPDRPRGPLEIAMHLVSKNLER